MIKPPPLLFFAFMAMELSASPRTEALRPERFGPYLQQSLDLSSSLSGFDDLVPFGSYSFQTGWVEPISPSTGGPFQGTTLEAQGNISVSPYQSDIGTVFNLRPIRFMEFGVGYNRLVYHYSLMGYSHSSVDSLTKDEWKASNIMNSQDRQTAGADVFTFQGKIMVNLGRLQVNAGGNRSLWDVDVQDKNILFEYHSGMLIKKRDRINSVYARAIINLDPYLGFFGFTAQGFEIRNHFWWTSQTAMQQNLSAIGLTGLRWGKNNSRSQRGLDILLGLWTEHTQLNGRNGWDRLSINLQWSWNAQVLDLSAD